MGDRSGRRSDLRVAAMAMIGLVGPTVAIVVEGDERTGQ
jgi:hypothetical protein